MYLLKIVLVLLVVSHLDASPNEVYDVAGLSSIKASAGHNNSIEFKSIEKNSILTNEFQGRFFLTANRVVFRGPSGDMLIVGYEKMGKLSICANEFSLLCEIALGKKHSDSLEESLPAILSLSFSIKRETSVLEGAEDSYFNNLEEYVFSSPNQQDGGTCLFMSTTGALEILLNQAVAPEYRKYDGDTDLSERFLMNVNHEVPEWRTDIIYKFNKEKGALLNRDYRFTKGWYKEETNDDGERSLLKAEPDSEDALYGVYYNWIDEYTDELKDKLIDIPVLERTILFADEEKDQWNVGIINSDEVINKIKNELWEKNAPVLVMYNHYGYWHAALVVGYDDNEEVGACPFVMSWKKYMEGKAKDLLDSEDERKVKRGKKYMEYVNRVKENSQDGALCNNKGVFFVRDSIYTGPDSLIYNYDFSRDGEEAPYSKKIVKKSYDWVKYLGNHVYSIHLKELE